KQKDICADCGLAFFASQGADQFDDRTAHLRIGDAGKSFVQLKAFARSEKIDDITFVGLFSEARHRRAGALSADWCLVVKKLYGYAEHPRKVEEPARANAIDALFVFLHLLECEAQMLAKLFLAHAEQHAPKPYARADMHIHRIGTARPFGRVFGRVVFD